MEKPLDKILEVKDLEVELMSPDGLVKAVRGASIYINRGEIHGIVGESGCGKSVMMKSVMKLHNDKNTVYGGQILFGDSDILKLEDKEMKRIRGKEISMIFQNPMTSLSPIMKIGDQISESIVAKQKINKEEAKKKACEILELVGITPASERYNMYPFELSGGLLQRVMIAIAMVNEPELLIADEPTTALDVTIQAQILNLMKKMQKDTGVSIVFITHDLGVVAEMCDRVSVMYAGKIVETGTVFDIFNKPGHPYTKALVESMPKGVSEENRLKTIHGTPPSLHSKIVGCSFAPRCKYSCDKCLSRNPLNVKLAEEHFAACLYSNELYEKGEIVHEE